LSVVLITFFVRQPRENLAVYKDAAVSPPAPVSAPSQPPANVASASRELSRDKPAEAPAVPAPSPVAKKKVTDRDETAAPGGTVAVTGAIDKTDTIEKDARAKQAEEKKPDALKAEALSDNKVATKEAATEVAKAQQAAGGPRQQNQSQNAQQNAPQVSASSPLVPTTRAAPPPPPATYERSAIAAGALVAGIGFNYSTETKGRLKIIPTANGYLTVRSGDTALFPTTLALAGVTTDIPLSSDVQNVTILFSETSVPISKAILKRSDSKGVARGSGTISLELSIKP
jgi:hypothetical protein